MHPRGSEACTARQWIYYGRIPTPHNMYVAGCLLQNVKSARSKNTQNMNFALAGEGKRRSAGHGQVTSYCCHISKESKVSQHNITTPVTLQVP